MPTRKSSLLRGILIIIISVGLFGFRSSDEPPLGENQYTNLIGWVQITIHAAAGSGGGNSASYYEWFPVDVTLLISREPNSSTWIVQGKSAYTLLHSYGIFAEGEGSFQAFVPVSWVINAILYPDCTLEFVIIVVNYPGKSLACAPIVGCIEDSVPADIFLGPILKMAGNDNIVQADFHSINSTSGTFTIIKESMSAGGDCLYLSPSLP